MPISRVLCAAIVACAVSSLPATLPAFAQALSPPQPILKKAKERGAVPEAQAVPAGKAKSDGVTRQRQLTLCVESWDAQTHMSRQEWRTACERSVKEYPTAFR
jgi:hypothetical protein